MSTPSKKQTPKVEFNPADLYKSRLDMDPALAKELKEAGLVGRWINAKEFQKNYGFHHSGWTPYKKKAAPNAKVDSLFGGDPEGYVRRGDLVLAVKTTEEQEKHRMGLAYKASLNTGLNKKQAQQIAEAARNAGVKSKVVDGYDGAGDDDEDDEA
jgi:hypothetical protein